MNEPLVYAIYNHNDYGSPNTIWWQNFMAEIIILIGGLDVWDRIDYHEAIKFINDTLRKKYNAEYYVGGDIKFDNEEDAVIFMLKFS